MSYSPVQSSDDESDNSAASTVPQPQSLHRQFDFFADQEQQISLARKNNLLSRQVSSLQSKLSSMSTSSSSSTRVTSHSHFDGAVSTNAKHWLKKTKLIFSLEKKPEAEMCLTFPLLLKEGSPAALWWENITRGNTTQLETQWTLIEQAFNTRWVRSNDDQVRVQLEILKQEDSEGVEEYSTRIQALFNGVNNPPMSTGEQLTHFVNKLTKDIRDQVRLSRPKTMEEAFETAMIVEQNVILANLETSKQQVQYTTAGRTRGKPAGISQVNAVSANESGSELAEMMRMLLSLKKEITNIKTGQSSTPSSSNSSGSGNYSDNRSTIKCFNCNRMGHYSTVCKQPWTERTKAIMAKKGVTQGNTNSGNSGFKSDTKQQAPSNSSAKTPAKGNSNAVAPGNNDDEYFYESDDEKGIQKPRYHGDSLCIIAHPVVERKCIAAYPKGNTLATPGRSYSAVAAGQAATTPVQDKREVTKLVNVFGMSPDEPSPLHGKVDIEGVRTTLVPDSGAAKSLIARKLVNRLPAQLRQQIQPMDTQYHTVLTSASGDILQQSGTVKLQVIFADGTNVGLIKFIVVENSSIGAIMGMDTLTKPCFGAIHPRNKTIEYTDRTGKTTLIKLQQAVKEVPREQQPVSATNNITPSPAAPTPQPTTNVAQQVTSKIKRATIGSVYLNENITIPPHSETIVASTRIKGIQQFRERVIKEAKKAPDYKAPVLCFDNDVKGIGPTRSERVNQAIKIAPSVDVADDALLEEKRCPAIHLFNRSPQAIKLTAGTRLGGVDVVEADQL